jgi:hypothetical protein
MTGRRLVHAVAATVLAAALACTVLELGVRVWMPQLPFSEPARDVLFLSPDPVVGWTHPGSFTFSWNGRNPYCIEFRVEVTTNAFGFRDREWSIAKPIGTIRIAILGDSFIEALQVPLELTATRQLATRLSTSVPERRIETLNFGVSNYGVGQYLMMYEQYVRQFRPDYVVVVASYLNFSRTTQRELTSRLQEFYKLHVRPSYVVDERGVLQYVPARDYEAYVRGVTTLLNSEFSDNRSMTIPPIRSPLALPHAALHLVSRKARPAPSPHSRTATTFPDVELNYRILEMLHERTRADGATLVFADAFEFLERYGVVRGSGALTAGNRALMERLGAGYVDLSPALRASPANPQFECDMHFNETGNRVIADALAGWFERALTESITEGPGRSGSNTSQGDQEIRH